MRDYEITLKLLEWMKELGQKPRHDLWLLHDARVPKEDVAAILSAARAVFLEGKDITAKAEVDGWPEGANYMFRTMTANLSYNSKYKYFLWMEPDAIPLKPDWLDTLEKEYLKAKKPFMGDRVEVENIPLHMSGVGIYQNPVYNLAGEAYRASDVAWDMAAKDQIVPNAHFTNLIEHAWRHKTFTDRHELTTQMRPEAVLFHSSKDGSLIRLLRDEKQRANQQERISTIHGNIHETRSFDTAQDKDETLQESVSLAASGTGQRGIFYDIFIRTYPTDYAWLDFCLVSIAKYVTGFRKIWIVSPEEPGLLRTTHEKHLNIKWKKMNEESPDGYLSQQIHKLYADVITDYEPDYILHIDSDTLFTRPVTPQHFFTQPLGSLDVSKQKPIWYYTPYEHTETPWKPITEKFMGMEVKNEFMRRLPMMVPRTLYDELRKFCFGTHNLLLGDYVRKQPYREFSEFNALGAYAFQFNHSLFHWVDTTQAQLPEPFARQFYSWGGLTEQVKAEIQTILGGGDAKCTEKTSSTEIEGSRGSEAAATVQSDGAANNNLTIGEHVRAIADYAGINNSKRQYVMKLLRDKNLHQLRRRRK